MARVTLGTGESITVGGDTEIFGTSGAQNVTILDGSTVTFRSGFNSGGDTIRLNGTASDFVVSFSGSNVTLLSVTDGITIVIPIGVVANTIVFDNGDSRTLSLVNGVPTLGGQAIPNINNAAPAPVTPGAGTYSIEGSNGTEGENVTFTVTRTDTTSAETLNFTLQGDTANGQLPAASLGSDVSVLSPSSGTITFAAGAATATITVRLSADTAVEGLEGYKVNVIKGNTTVASAAAVIIDNNEGGQVFNLTTGVDRVGTGTLLDIVGSAGNTNTDGQDTIVADTGTINPFDVIDGGDDTDTLIVLDEVGFLNPAPSFAFTDIQNVEILNYSSASRGFSGNAFNTTLPVTTDVGLRPNWEGLEQANIAINGGPAQTVTLRTETALNIRQAGDGDLTINGGGGVLNVIAADFAEEANTGDVTVGATSASNEWTEINVRGGFDVDITDRGAQELTTVTLTDINDDFTITGGAVSSVSLMDISDAGPGSSTRFGTINSDVAVTLGLTGIVDVELDILSTGPALTVNADAETIALDGDSDIQSDGTLVINSTSGTFVFDDASAVGSITLNAAPGNFSLDNVDSDSGVVNISGSGSVFIDTVVEVVQTSGTVITSTNTGGVTINDQLGNNTKFVGTASGGDDFVTFGATDRANSFGGGDDTVTFNADAFGNDAATDGDNGAFDGGAGFDSLVMESNDANTFTATAKAVTNFEELVLSGQDIGKSDVIDLHNIGMDTISNVVSNVGATGDIVPSVKEVATLDFTGGAGATWLDVVQFSGVLAAVSDITLADGDTPADIADKVANQINIDLGGTYVAVANAGVVTLTAVAGGNIPDIGANDITFVDSTTPGAPFLEAGSPTYSALFGGDSTGAAPSAEVPVIGRLNLTSVTVLPGETITIEYNNIDGSDGVFTYTNSTPNALTNEGGTLAQAIVDAANADPDFFADVLTSRDGNDVVFTGRPGRTQDDSEFIFTGSNTGLTAGLDDFELVSPQGFAEVVADFEVFNIFFDGGTTGNDTVTFDGVTVTFADGSDPASMAAQFVAQYTASTLPKRWSVAVDGNGILFPDSVEFTALVPEARDDITLADFVFDDDDNVGTPSVAISTTTQGDSTSVTLNNFISGSTLTLNAALGTHIVNMKSDTAADVLNLDLNSVGDHGVVTAKDAETVNIRTLQNTGLVDTVDLLGGDLTTLVISGPDGLTLDTNSTKISSIDASGLGGLFTWSADANTVNIIVKTGSGDSIVDFSGMTSPLTQSGNTFTNTEGNQTAPVLFIGGSGDDTIITGGVGTARGTIVTGGGEDNIFVGVVDGGNDFWSIDDFNVALDELEFAGFGAIQYDGPAEFGGLDQELEPTAIFQDYLDQAARGAGDGTIRYFYWQGDTYVVQDNTDGDDFTDGRDTVIRIEGEVVLTADNFI